MSSVHKIRRWLAIPLAITLFFILVLLLLTWFTPAFAGERAVFSALFLLAAYLVGEVFYRRVTFRETGLEIRKHFRKTEFKWDEITHLGFLVLGTKVYLLLTTIKGYYILSNNYERFPALLRELCGHLGADKVDEGIGGLLEHPLHNHKPIYSAWITVLVIMAITIWRFF